MRIALLDTETTGLPFLKKDGLFHMVEMAAVVFDTETFMLGLPAPFHVLVNPGEDVLRHPATQEGLNLSRTPLVEEVRAWGLQPHQVETAWDHWAKMWRVDKVMAFNNAFDRAVTPFIRQPWARCLMRWSGQVVKRYDPGADCIHNKHGQYKHPKVSEMAAWLRAQGHHVPPAMPEHRAMGDTRQESVILVRCFQLDPAGIHQEDA